MTNAFPDTVLVSGSVLTVRSTPTASSAEFFSFVDNFSLDLDGAAIPERGTVALFALGLLVAGFGKRRRNGPTA